MAHGTCIGASMAGSWYTSHVHVWCCMHGVRQASVHTVDAWQCSVLTWTDATLRVKHIQAAHPCPRRTLTLTLALALTLALSLALTNTKVRRTSLALLRNLRERKKQGDRAAAEVREIRAAIEAPSAML